MKKVLIITFILVSLSAGIQAQSYKTALGLRMGDPFGVTFKSFISDKNALEGIVGTGYWGHNFSLTGYYQWQMPTGWAPSLDWYVGPGAHLAFWDNDSEEEYNGRVLVGIDGIIGLEYTLDDVPLNFSIGFGPTIQFTASPGWYYWNGGLSVRYVF